MNRTLVGLLAAAGALMSMLASLAHGALLCLAIMVGVTAAGLAAYLALQDPQKKVRNVRLPRADRSVPDMTDSVSIAPVTELTGSRAAALEMLGRPT